MTGEVNAAIAGIRAGRPRRHRRLRLARQRPKRADRQAARRRAARARISAAARDDAGDRRDVHGGGVHRLPRERVDRGRRPRSHDLERAAAGHQAERDGGVRRDLQRGAGRPVRRPDRVRVRRSPRGRRRLQKVVPAAEGAIVKEPYGYHSAHDRDAGARSGHDPRGAPRGRWPSSARCSPIA